MDAEEELQALREKLKLPAAPKRLPKTRLRGPCDLRVAARKGVPFVGHQDGPTSEELEVGLHGRLLLPPGHGGRRGA